jgi:GNAT superfamily N-acetyltransferase
MSDPGAFTLRAATPDDAAVIADHRARMFWEMGELAVERIPDFVDRATRYLRQALASGEYVAWLATPADAPGPVVAGAGAQIRRTLPHPREADGTPHGRQAIVLNVFTEPAWRGRGAARQLMQRIIAWAREAPMDSLVLHASTAGRPLYERLGFAATSEMRFSGELRPAAPRQKGNES